MDVDSVSCGDNVCEVIKVRLYWDALGGYLRYEFPKGGDLTKDRDDPFSAADYEKLNMILSDPNSDLQTFNPSTLMLPEPGHADVDAVTKPTPLFYQNSVVKGAIYTCYTLWHWVNGDVPKKIVGLTSKACAPEQLMQYVNDGSDKFFLFALDQIGERGIFDQATATAIIERANTESDVFMQGAIRYFERSLKKKIPDFYYDAIMRFFTEGDSLKRTLCLRSLDEVEQFGPPEFYNKMVDFLPELDSYFEVHLLLNLFEKIDLNSEQMVTQALHVLENDNFLIARRAYWFLEKRVLSGEQAKTVEDFRMKYENRL